MSKKLEREGSRHTNNQGLDFIVTKYVNWNNVYIQFIETGFEKKAQWGQIDKKEVRDTSTFKDRWIGKIFLSNSGNEYEIIEQLDAETFRIKFLKTKTIKIASRKLVTDHKVRDEYEVSVLNEGILGRPNILHPDYEKISSKWHHMLTRCYSENEHNTAKQKANVCSRWKTLEYFMDDFDKIEGYMDWFFDKSYELDKDKKGDGTLYSLEHCCLISKEENCRIKKGI